MQNGSLRSRAAESFLEKRALALEISGMAAVRWQALAVSSKRVATKSESCAVHQCGTPESIFTETKILPYKVQQS